MKQLLVLLMSFFWVLHVAEASAADHPWQISSEEGDSTIAFGFLAQGQAEGIRTKTGVGNSQDLYVRRFRLIASGKLSRNLNFFVQTDSPNLGKGTAGGGKVEERIFFQDIVLTYAFRTQFQLDAGLLLVAYSHNSGQSAASLLPIDYGPYTYLASEPTGSRAGRDYGVQVRGYLFNQHFEYRAGMFQGSRTPGIANPGATNQFRYSGRIVWYPFEAETGFFYTGTTLGTKKIFSIGAGLDHQMEYDARSFDLFFDRPLGRGDGITLQAGYTHMSGGMTFPQLPRAHILMAEAGYYNRSTKLGPFLQLSYRMFSNPQANDSKRYSGGIAYWGSGHSFNIKLGIGRTLGIPSTESWQVVLQGQAFMY